MRYIVTMSNGETFATDFEDAGIVRGLVQELSPRSKMVICRVAVRGHTWWAMTGASHQRYLNPQHIVTILDNDCG